MRTKEDCATIEEGEREWRDNDPDLLTARTFVLVQPVAADESDLADMAPALALMRADPLARDAVDPFTFSQHFEAWPNLWRSNAIGVHTRGEWPLSEPLP